LRHGLNKKLPHHAIWLRRSSHEFAERIIGKIYPERVVDRTTSTASAQDRIYGARQGPAFHAAADAIQAKH
jgi:hypothetical protein